MSEEFVDDPTIGDDERLLRRIHPSWVLWQENGSPSISSAAFKDPEMSVYIESVLLASGRIPEDCLSAYKGFGLATITAGLARSLDQCVTRDPVAGEPAHGLVLGKKRSAVATKLRDGAHWIIPPSRFP